MELTITTYTRVVVCHSLSLGDLALHVAMGSMVVVEVLPLPELVVEHLSVVDHDPVEHPIELLVIDAMGTLNLAVEPRVPRPDVDVPDPFVQDVPVEGGLELSPVVCLDYLDQEGKPLEHVVETGWRSSDSIGRRSEVP